MGKSTDKGDEMTVRARYQEWKLARKLDRLAREFPELQHPAEAERLIAEANDLARGDQELVRRPAFLRTVYVLSQRN